MNYPQNRNSDSRIKVLRIISRMNVGGPAVQISGLMRSLDQTRFNQVLVTGFCDKNEVDYLNVVAKDIPATQIVGFGKRLNFFSDFRTLIFLIRFIRAFQPDIVHTHTAKAGIVGRIASFVSFQNSKRIHTFHGHLLTGYYGKFGTKLIIMSEKVLAKISALIFTVGVQVKNDLVSARIAKSKKIRVVPPGLDINFNLNKSEARKILGLDQNSTYCGFIGRITQIKRPDRFIEAIKIAKTLNSKTKYLIVGSGELETKMREVSAEFNLPITFLGWRSDIENILPALDFVTLTSDNEGMPVSLIQAGMAGLPAIATNVGSVSEVVIQAKTGFLTNTNAEEIATRIIELENNPGLRKQMGEEARVHSAKEFSLARLVSDHEKYYLDSLKL